MKIISHEIFERQMNQTELAIAQILETETGIRAHIVLLPNPNSLPKGISYSSYFVFSQEIGEETFYYRIESDPLNVVNQSSVAFNGQNREMTKDHQALVRPVFSKFRPSEELVHRPFMTGGIIPELLVDASLHVSFSPSVPTPPPERA